MKAQRRDKLGLKMTGKVESQQETLLMDDR